ncbi:MAG: hypothetical protein DMG07_17605 [Acidobacteria bacterium]|nr:MAG: hypothetical protein DMG07_17605 [Acidobacteriota bacterium]
MAPSSHGRWRSKTALRLFSPPGYRATWSLPCLRRSSTAWSSQSQAASSSRAVLYALDATTGKELWSSGDTITSFLHDGGLSGGGSQLYLGTYDGMLYAFGFPIEH